MKMKQLNAVALEKIVGGLSSPFTLGPACEPIETDEPRDGGATGGW
jgi:hypothetical protein